MTALRGSAFLQSEASLQVVSDAKDNNANFAWVQHFIHHLAPHGMAGFVLANKTRGAHSRSMKITEGLRKYAAEQGSRGKRL